MEKTCTLVYNINISLNFMTKTYPSFCLKTYIYINWKFSTIFFSKNVLDLSEQKFFQSNWQNIFFINWKKFHFEYTKWKYQLNHLGKNLFLFNWRKIPFKFTTWNWQTLSGSPKSEVQVKVVDWVFIKIIFSNHPPTPPTPPRKVSKKAI